MTAELALTELRRALELITLIGVPLLLAVLVVGVVVGVLQAATQINEPTIAFVAKALALVAVFAVTGNWILGNLVDYTTSLIQRIPQLIGS